MKLVLKNFGCWTDRTFEFPDVGNILLSAPSGSGKTTVIRAILFAVFGNGNKLMSFGKRSCSVSLIYKDLHIIRTKGPGRLIVNKVFEDDAGEAVIRKHFSNDLFYLAGNEKRNFVMMSATEKLHFLENILFENIPLVEIKNKIKHRITDYEKTLVSEQSKRSVLSSMYEEMGNVPTPTRFDLTEDVLDEFDRCHHLYMKTQQEQQQQAVRQSQMHQYKCEMNSLDSTIDELDYKLLSVQDKLAKFANVDNDIAYLEKLRKYAYYKKKYDEQKSIYEDLLQNDHKETERIRTIIETLQQQLTTLDNPSHDSLRSQREQLKTYHSLQQQIVGIPRSSITKHGLAALEKQYVNLKLQENSYTCPSCTAHVYIRDGCMKLLNDDNVDGDGLSLEELSDTIALYRRRLSIVEQLCELEGLGIHELDMDHIERLLTIVSDLRMNRSILESKTKKSSKYATIEQTLHKYKQRIELYTPNTLDDQLLDDMEISNRLKQLHDQKYSEKLLFNSQTEYKLQRQSHVDKRSQYACQLRELAAKELELSEIFTTHEELLAKKEQVDEYHKLQTYKKKQQLSEKLQTIDHTLQTAQQSLSNLLKFKKQVLLAEATSMRNLIQTINLNVQSYLDAFFPVSPMSAVLLSEKTTQKGVSKTSLHLEIEYKGNKIDLSSLSSGERDRVVLSFMLTIANMSTTGLLLLDECVSSLDEENACRVFDTIKSNTPNKLVILVAHQIVTGMFDGVVRL